MEPSEEQEKANLVGEPFPTTHSTLNEPAERASLDDRRLADRQMGSTLSDQEIAGRAIFALAEDGRLNLGDGLQARISIKSEGHIVTLTGVVDCAGERMLAEELVEAIPGVELVQNAITVSVDRYLDDEDLQRQIRNALDSSGLSWVGVKVSHGVARLMGTTEKLADGERAIRVAAGVKGVRDVISGIKVRMPEYADDIDLLSLATQALSLNDLVIIDRQVQVKDGIVHISGKVQSLRDLRRVRSILREIAGIREIKDNLQIDHGLFRDWQARTQLSTGR